MTPKVAKRLAPFRNFRSIMEERFDSVVELGGYYSDRFGVSRLLQRFPERVDMEPSRDHTVNISMGACFAVEKYDRTRLAGVVERPNAVTVIQKGEETSWRAPGLVDVLHIYFDGAKLIQFIERDMEISKSVISVHSVLGADDAFLRHLAPALFEEIKGGAPRDRLLLDSCYVVLARHFIRTYTSARGSACNPLDRAKVRVDKEVVGKAKDFLLENLSESLSLDAVASHVAVPSVPLRDMFKAETGHSPYQFVVAHRIARAQELLAEGGTPLAEVAYACGFASQSHMTDVFRQKLGVTPGRYRKEVRG